MTGCAALAGDEGVAASEAPVIETDGARGACEVDSPRSSPLELYVQPDVGTAPFAAAMFFIGGVGHGTKNVLVRTLIQARVPDAMHGRAFAAYNGLRNGAEMIALAAGGVAVAALGGRATLAIAGAVPTVVALVGLALYRRSEDIGEVSSSPAALGRGSAGALSAE